MNAHLHAAARCILAAALSTGLSGGFAADMVRGGDVQSMSQWYGRAGGLAGSQRVKLLTAHPRGMPVSVAYDREVAERTNMPRGGAAEGPVTVSYDREVAERTNMPRAGVAQPAVTQRAGGTSGASSRPLPSQP